MPRDVINEPIVRPRIATKNEFWSASPAERRIMLAELLESGKLPLRWDFSIVQRGLCGCAIGNAVEQWESRWLPWQRWPVNERGNLTPSYRRLERFFGMSATAASGIFGLDNAATQATYGCPHKNVTPAMVASALRAYGED